MKFSSTLVSIWMVAASVMAEDAWHIIPSRDELRIFYREPNRMPQYGVLHLRDGYLRLNYGPDSSWGTSVVLVPSLWVHGEYYHGAPVTASWTEDGQDLVVDVDGQIASLRARLKLRIAPPNNHAIVAWVEGRLEGEAALDARPGESFKLVNLSSMHMSSEKWDGSIAVADGRFYSIPPDEWVIPPNSPVMARRFGLLGGTSDWKTNAVTVMIELDQPRQICGWVTPTEDPDDDNLGLWAAAEEVARTWSYKIVVHGL